ncbi:SDR family NAD(P)-dependent oxidoreductase [Aeromicrobium sp. CTD01-1L150]|uniref:SDR family NAD(P)-dependent oxidoreductase n=1 Tax=Aeromicrobium sp. CTD01-1L150 TaxID=3341830 RepID=UPI0035BF9467
MIELSPVMVVTGGGRGIGRQVALNAAAESFRVVVADVDQVAARAVEDEIRAAGGSARTIAVDMREVESVRGVVDDVMARDGRLDVLVNNAAMTRGIDFFDVEVDDWDAFFEVNARGAFFAMQFAARHMTAAGRGSIVNVASIAGKGWPGTSNIAYAGTKGALVAMTRVAAARLGADGVRVNAVCPGVTETALMRDLLESRARDGRGSVEHQRSAMAGLASLTRITQPDDVAEAVLFLATDRSAGITGQSLNVDSGIMWD